MRRHRRPQEIVAQIALVPAWVMVIVGYVVTILWSIRLSFTSSRSLPNADFVGLQQYRRLFSDDRWLIAVSNIGIFGVLFVAFSLVLGFFLAMAIDRKIRGEDLFRTIALYPYAMSFVVTGLVWQWMMNPEFGVQHSVRLLGWESFTFDWVVDPDTALYALVIAGVWQSAGLVMAILLAGMRGVDPELWKAARIDGVPAWRYYVSIVLPLIEPMIATATVLLAIGVIKAYDLVVSLTRGGPGLSTEVPAKYVMDFLFTRANIALATAASTMMLITVIAALAPYLWLERARRRAGVRP